MLKRQFEKIWDQLRVKKSQLPYYLDDVRIQSRLLWFSRAVPSATLDKAGLFHIRFL
jgi:hypothetical protein